MQYDYDRETDILTITLSSDSPDFGEQRENIITHYNRDNKPVEIEILDASKTMVKILETMIERK